MGVKKFRKIANVVYGWSLNGHFLTIKQHNLQALTTKTSVEFKKETKDLETTRAK